jgi:hypothetical protein
LEAVPFKVFLYGLSLIFLYSRAMHQGKFQVGRETDLSFVKWRKEDCGKVNDGSLRRQVFRNQT